ncbi:unnamed protein product [Closterium sp. NIES-54]
MPRTTGVTGSAANSERQEQRTHGRLAQLATTGLPKQGLRTTGAAGDKTATFTQPPPTAPLPSHTSPVTVDSVGVGVGGTATGGTWSGGARWRGVGDGGAGASGASSGGAGAGGPGIGGASSRGAGAGGASAGGASSRGTRAGGTGAGAASSGGAGAGGAGAVGASIEEKRAGGTTTAPLHFYDTRLQALRRLEREEQEQLEQERQELQQLDQQQQQQPPYSPPLQQLFPPVSGLQALGLPSFPPVHSQSPTAPGQPVSVSAEGDCYLYVMPDPGIEAAALGASESTLPGTAPAEALHTFTLDSGVSRFFFRDSTTLTPLSAPVLVRRADPSKSPVLACSSTVLPCPASVSSFVSGSVRTFLSCVCTLIEVLNLWPRVSLPETSPTLRWTGGVGDVSVFWVWGSHAFVRHTSADKLSARAIPCGPAPLGVSQVDPLPCTLPIEVAVGLSAAQGAASGGAASGSAEPGEMSLRSGGAEPGGAEPRGAEPAGAEPGDAEPEGLEPGGAESEGAESGGAEPRGIASSGATRAGVSAASDTGAGGVGVPAGAGGTGGTAAAGLGGARTRGTGAAGTGSVGGAEFGRAGAGGAGAGGAGAGGTGAGGARAGGAGAGDTGAVGAELEALVLVALALEELELETLGLLTLELEVLEQGVLGLPSSTGLTPPLLCPPPDLSQPPLQPASPLLAPSPYTKQTGGLTERCEPVSCLASPVRVVCTGRRVPRPRPPFVTGTHAMALCLSSIPLRVPLPPPPTSSLPTVPHPESDRARAASPAVSRLLATVLTDPSFESTAESTLVVELVDFATACCLDYATALVAESESASPSSVGGECAFGTDVLEDRQEDLECLATAAATDAKTASWKSTGTYADAVPPSRANIVDGMWIFRVKRPPGSPPAFKARYVARGFSIGAAGAGGAAGVGAGDPGARVTGAGGAGPGDAGAVGAGSGDTGQPRPYFVPLLQQVLGLPSSIGLTPPLLCPPPDQSQPPLQPASPLPAPSPYTEHTGGLTQRRQPVSRPASHVRAVRTGRHVP